MHTAVGLLLLPYCVRDPDVKFPLPSALTVPSEGEPLYPFRTIEYVPETLAFE